MKMFIGLIFIVVGILFFGNQIEWWNVDVFFDGWWTLFIIVPSVISLFKKEFAGGLVGLAVGISLLLSVNDIIDWKMLGPIVIILIGLTIMFSTSNNKKKVKEGSKNYIAVFSGSESKVTDEFTGTNAIAVFGGVDLDLRKAIISEDIVIDVSCVFGGVDILVSDNVKVVVECLPIFGGVDNLVESNKGNTIFIKGICVFGGITIK